jgi:glycosyltransferase involved in cell wall biosynthesis
VRQAERQDARVRGIWLPLKGASRARNAGATAATYDTIAFIDDDCEATPDWLDRLNQSFRDDPEIGMVAGALVAPPTQGWRPAMCPSSMPGDFTLRPGDVSGALPHGSAFVTANCAVRRWAWDRIGPFDEELGAGTPFRGGEDLDFFLRAIGAGVPIRFRPDAVVHHTAGTRYGVRSVLGVSVAYASGQGAVAAKLTLRSGSGAEWLQEIRAECLTRPLRRLQPHRIALRLPRLLAFERAYRRCLGDYTLDGSGLLTRRPA